jgi:hypothetical protein
MSRRVASSSIFRFFSSKCAATVVPSSTTGALAVDCESEGCEGSDHPVCWLADWLALTPLSTSPMASSSPTPSVFVSSFL